jgi:thymidylate synthase ThyX
MHETRPSVFLLARPSLDLDGMAAYLREVGGAAWLERRVEEAGGAPNPGELLVEFAGRACYRSWEPGLNPNVTRVRTDQRAYFANLLASAHGSVLEHASYTFALRDVSRVFCYDAETEVLTSTGWKPWPRVDGSELFATLNPATNALEYQYAQERFEGEYDGPMYRVRSEQVDLLVTPHHRMWIQRHGTHAERRGEQPYRMEHAQDIVGKRVRYQKTATWSGQEDGFVHLPDVIGSVSRPDTGTTVTRTSAPATFPLRAFARFLGWYLAEGSLDVQRIVVSQGRGPELDEIAETVRDLGLIPYSQPSGGVAVRNEALRGFLTKVGSTAGIRRIPSMVHEWGPETLREFLDAFVVGDGSRRGDRNHGVVHTTSRSLADDLQVLAIKAGWSANIRVDDRVRHGRVTRSGQVFHRRRRFIVTLVKTRTRPLVNHDRAKPHDSWQHYSGKVYCVKVPNGLLFVRRGGKPVVCANTHELVRHRAGSAFSQESLRYVRLADIGFRVPPALEPLREQVVRIVEQLEEFQVEAAGQLGIDDEGVPFHVKKEVTSALRRLAPIGLSTDIIWTANLRTLRHVIEMRTAPGAEEELRLVFDAVARIMLEEAPGLFQDFSQDGDGAWVPEHRKV